ncbi:MAG: hypothetical protein ACO2ZM_08960 [Francisellaceae bacterium]
MKSRKIVAVIAVIFSLFAFSGSAFAMNNDFVANQPAYAKALQKNSHAADATVISNTAD